MLSSKSKIDPSLVKFEDNESLRADVFDGEGTWEKIISAIINSAVVNPKASNQDLLTIFDVQIKANMLRVLQTDMFC